MKETQAHSLFVVSFILMMLSQIALAENKKENLRRCLDGNYPSLCKYHSLTEKEKSQAKEAERQVNLRRCLDGNYPSLCKYNLLSPSELKQAEEAEIRVNLRRCLDGNYPTLCKYNLLSQNEFKQTKEAERQVNLRRCLDGNYPTLCNYGLLSEKELKEAKQAESKAKKIQKEDASKGGAVAHSKNGGCYEASITKPSPFMGNDGEIFKLDDGSLWEVKYEYEYLYEYYPEVIICPSKGKLVIEGKSLDIEYVSKNGGCYEASITKPSPFMGNDGEIFKLDDGSLWEVKYEYEYLYEYYPEVIICPSKGKLVIEGKSLDIEYVGGH